ncbi:MAG: hypothetical protein RET84_02665 [Pseudomonadota bacterium]|nr:hypothetical protein [Pseudomonadota bacterium]
MNALKQEYANSFPDSDEESFVDDVIEPAKEAADWIVGSTSPLGPEAHKALSERITQGRQQIETSVFLIHVSCAYAISCLIALEANDKDLAWDFLCQACFFLGSPAFTNHLSVAFPRQLADAQISARASKAGAIRHEQTNKLREHTYSVMRAQAPWLSQARAAAIIEGELKEKFGEDCLRDYGGTIERWLKQMPDRLELIPSLRKRLKQDAE